MPVEPLLTLLLCAKPLLVVLAVVSVLPLLISLTDASGEGRPPTGALARRVNPSPDCHPCKQV
jgi:hypothetical protein